MFTALAPKFRLAIRRVSRRLRGSKESVFLIREKEFAPIKNATGVDSVETARELLKKNGVAI